MVRPEFLEEDGEELAEEESPPKKKSRRIALPDDMGRYLSQATSFLGLTAIAILTFELLLGTIRLGTILAYALSTAVMLGFLILMFMGFNWGSKKVPKGMLRWSFWLIAAPFGLFYYLLIAYFTYNVMAHGFMKLMKMAFANAL